MKILEADDLSFSYGKTMVLDQIRFSLDEGGFAALIGFNGAGKSTLIRLLLGELTPNSGSIRLMGQEISRFKGWSKIGYVPQEGLNRQAAFPASVNEVVTASLYHQIGLFRWPSKENREQVRKALELVGMQDYGKRMLRELSGGQRQRVALAQALAAEPALLLLDEPTAGLDVKSAGEFYALLQHLNREHGLSILMVSHDVQEVSRLTDTIFRLAHGKITQQDPKELNRFV